MERALLLNTGRVAAETTVERLQELGIEAEISYLPNVFVRLLSGGNYAVRVTVPEAELARARAELRRLEQEAAPRVSALAREVSRTLAAATLAAGLLAGGLVASGAGHAVLWSVLLWVLWMASWVVRSRARARSPGTTQAPPGSGMLVALAFAHGGTSQPPSDTPLRLYELIAQADVCAAGEIVAEHPTTVDVQIETVGFGDVAGRTISVSRFCDSTSAHRWAAYEVGQRCLYFLNAGSTLQIMGAGGEGELPLLAGECVRSWDMHDPVPLATLMQEARRYREVFRYDEGGHWIEPRAGEVDAYQRSSDWARSLCDFTLVGAGTGEYFDATARSQRRPETTPRVDLGVGAQPSALASLPDFDGDVGSALAVAQWGRLALVRLDGEGNLRERSWIAQPGQHYFQALASLGDVGHDGTVELAVGDRDFSRYGTPGIVRVLSIDALGAPVQERDMRVTDDLFGARPDLPDNLGLGLANLGDLDGDSGLELAVSGGSDSGPAWIWIVSLDVGGRPVRARCLVEAHDALMGSLALAALGDLDGDGIGDLAASSSSSQRSDRPHGDEWVFFLASDGRVRKRVELPTVPHDGARFGDSLTAVGDWNGDSVPDIAVGPPAHVLFLTRDGGIQGGLALLPADEPLALGTGLGTAMVVTPRAGKPLRLWCAGAVNFNYGVYPSLLGFDVGAPAAGEGR